MQLFPQFLCFAGSFVEILLGFIMANTNSLLTSKRQSLSKAIFFFFAQIVPFGQRILGLSEGWLGTQPGMSGIK